MSNTSRSTSPDPLALPSSPLATRSTRYSSVKPVAFSSPSKSFIMDTGEVGDGSPWRIKVTVEAEPKEGSPSKNGRTKRVPMKGSSPMAKKGAGRRTVLVETEEVKRPQRKLIRRTTRTHPSQIDPTTEEDDAALMPPPSSTARLRSARRKSLQVLPTQRSKRLSQAREELDLALQDAVGYDEDEEVKVEDEEPAGDMTVMNEDFTMVSVETLQSMKGDTSMMSTRRNGEGEQSGLSVSFLPSSPPQHALSAHEGVRYPDLPEVAKKAKSCPAQAYDAMSWKATGAAKVASSSPKVHHHDEDEATQDSEPSEWRREREAVSRRIQEASTSQVIVIDDTVQQEQSSSSLYSDEFDEEEEVEVDAPAEAKVDEELDLWQEEASRSLNSEEDQPLQQPSAPPPQLNDLFADQPLKPPRAKIPRTWRRTSGNDFAYSDSPAHIDPIQARKRSGAGSTDGGGSRASSGVLTPPSTDDEAHKLLADGLGEESSDISLTHPDGVGTLIQPPEQAAAAMTADEEDGGEETGLFWQSNMPQLYQRPLRQRAVRPQRQRAMDLSELLGLGKSSSPAKKGLGSSPARKRDDAGQATSAYSPSYMRPVEGEVTVGGTSGAEVDGEGKVVSSPLRKSFLRSSKLGGSSPLEGRSRTGKAVYKPQSQDARRSVVDEREHEEEEDVAEESFASKASDQRQLLAEMAAGQSSGHRAMPQDADETVLSSEYSNHFSQDEETEDYQDPYDSELDDEEIDGGEEESTQDAPHHSYEEHLNIESPQKIRVKFNDSEGNSSLLAPKRDYVPLFATNNVQRAQHASPPTVTLVSKKSSAHTQTQEQQAGIFSRLTTTFWSAVVRPTGPSEIMPIPEPVYSPTLRAQIRSRYGVLSEKHPWTMAHMRTLHRMLNSCTSGKSDSIIPKTGVLPSAFSRLVGKQQTSVTGYVYAFTTQHAHVVDAFLAILVPAHVVEAMRNGEVETLGDPTALSYRGRLVDGRHGDDFVWGPSLGIRKSGSTIGVDFVVQALGDVVMSNEEIAARERAAAVGGVGGGRG